MLRNVEDGEDRDAEPSYLITLVVISNHSDSISIPFSTTTTLLKTGGFCLWLLLQDNGETPMECYCLSDA